MAYKHTALSFFFFRALPVILVIGFTFLPHGSIFAVITLQLLLLLPPQGRSSQAVP
jgi:hypothetical protein